MLCTKCNYEVNGGKIFQKHWEACNGLGPRRSRPIKPGGLGWAKGLTKDTDPTLQKISIALLGKIYPDRVISEEQKIKISSSMKQAHAEGRAWNIGQSRWNNEPSYPEQFL